MFLCVPKRKWVIMVAFARIGILILLAWLLPIPGLFAQLDSSIQSVNALSELWLKNSNLTVASPSTLGLDVVPSLWPNIQSAQSPQLLQQIEQYYNQKAKATRADYGISWNTNIIQNFDPQPTEENLFFKARTTTGFNWDILAGGLVANGFESKALVNEKNIELLSAMENRNQSVSYWSKNNILFCSMPKKYKC